MIKNIILFVVVLSCVGCYYTQTLTKETLAEQALNGNICVLTKDSLRYEFLEGHYTVTADSLIGTGGIGRRGESILRSRFSGSIPLSNVDMIETTEFSTGQTIALVAGVGVVVGVIVFASNFSFEGK